MVKFWGFARRHPIAVTVGVLLILSSVLNVLLLAPWQPQRSPTTAIELPADEIWAAAGAYVLIALLGVWIIGHQVVKERRQRRASVPGIVESVAQQ